MPIPPAGTGAPLSVSGSSPAQRLVGETDDQYTARMMQWAQQHLSKPQPAAPAQPTAAPLMSTAPVAPTMSVARPGAGDQLPGESDAAYHDRMMQVAIKNTANNPPGGQSDLVTKDLLDKLLPKKPKQEEPNPMLGGAPEGRLRSPSMYMPKATPKDAGGDAPEGGPTLDMRRGDTAAERAAAKVMRGYSESDWRNESVAPYDYGSNNPLKGHERPAGGQGRYSDATDESMYGEAALRKSEANLANTFAPTSPIPTMYTVGDDEARRRGDL